MMIVQRFIARALRTAAIARYRQLSKPRTFNQRVVGSIPTALTNETKDLNVLWQPKF